MPDLLFKRNKTIRYIVKVARKSPRDIKIIIEKAYQKKKGKHTNQAVQAYELFSKGKSLLEVTIELNLGQSQAMGYYN
ncbi:MAG TPA: hypothetical protein VE619_06365 [Nitrososphaeraceae archaeon]|nr:hypothetical protein [Nitrososphaeraceae archaeon]